MADSMREYYEQCIASEKSRLQILQRRRSALGWLRIGPILAIVLVFYFLWNVGWIYVGIGSAIFLFVFIRLVHADVTHLEKIKFTKTKILLFEKELSSINGEFVFDDGHQYIDPLHPYTSDMDIFGPYSLYQYLNRTTSDPGSDLLAGYLKAPAEKSVILQRQEAIKELSNNTPWIKDLQTYGTMQRFTNDTKNKLEAWIEMPASFQKFKPWKWLRFLLPAIILSILFLYLSGFISGSWFVFALLVFAAIAYQLDKVIAPIHHQLDDIAFRLKMLSSSIDLIEKKEFHSLLLKDMRSRLFQEEYKASSAIKKISKLLERLDLRYNLVLSFPLNILLLWNLQQIISLEKWREKYKNGLKSWLESIAEFETLNSFGIFSFNHRENIFPEILDNYFTIEGEEIGHPLIQKEKRVNNPVHIISSGKVMLVTGSNMAGKSTYLRSIGVNCILAFCGSSVCASSFRISHVSLISSMRIADNLQESTSTFYAELKKLKVIIDHVNAKEKIFILLDEILRGTNSIDRHTGSKALIKQLIEKKASAIVATHDLELAEIKEPYAENIINYHFDVQVENEELFFDYKLKEGICRSMNATILMKKIGIEI